MWYRLQLVCTESIKRSTSESSEHDQEEDFEEEENSDNRKHDSEKSVD